MFKAVLYFAAATMLAICIWALRRSEASERAAYTTWQARQKNKQSQRSAGFVSEMFGIILWGLPWLPVIYVLAKLFSRRG